MIIRKIPNFSRYTIDTNGNIFNEKTNRCISHILKNTGYLCVWLYDDNGNRKNLLLHRILLETFMTNPNNLPLVDHIDRNKLNNSLSNLRYASYSTNALNREKSYKKKKGKNIVDLDKRYRCVICKDGNKKYDKSFLKKNYSLEMVKQNRNSFCLDNGIGIYD